MKPHVTVSLGKSCLGLLPQSRGPLPWFRMSLTQSLCILPGLTCEERLILFSSLACCQSLSNVIPSAELSPKCARHMDGPVICPSECFACLDLPHSPPPPNVNNYP